MARRVSGSALIGRTDELDGLAAGLKRARAGEPSGVLIIGEAGIGKTRLLSEFQHAHAGVPFATGHCLELAPGNLAFAPWIEALLTIRRSPRSPAATVALELADLLDTSSADPQGTDRHAAATAARVFVGARRLLAAVSSNGPLVVVLEDLQWASRSTIELFEFLAASLRDERILLVGTLRTSSDPASPEQFAVETLRHQFDRLQGCELLTLNPLTLDQTRRLVTSLSGMGEADPLAAQLVKRSQGNPFFAEELVAFARAGGEGVPPSVWELITARLEGLSTAGRLVVELMSVAGRPVSTTLLESAAGLSQDNLVAAVRELASRALLDSQTPNQDELALRHSLVGEAIVQGLLSMERRQRHGQLADALGLLTVGLHRSASAAELAYHLEAAGRLEEAMPAAISAARAAFRAAAYGEADRLFSAALRIRDSLESTWGHAFDDRTAVLREAAEAAFAAGEGERAVDLTRAALDVPCSPEIEGDLRRRLGTYLLSSLRDDDALAELRRAVELLPSQPPSSESARALGTWGAGLMLGGRYRESRSLCLDALAAARAIDDTYLVGQMLSFLGVDLVNIGEIASGLDLLQEAVAVARQAGRTDGVLEATLNLSDMLNRADRLAEAAAVGQSGVEEAEKEGLARRIGTGLRAAVAAAHIRSGAWDEAETVLGHGLALQPTGEWLVTLLVRRARLGMLRGRLAEAHADLDQAAAQAHSRRVDVWPILAGVRAELAVWQGKLPEARDAVQQALGTLTGTDADHLRACLLSVAARIEADEAERCRFRRLPTQESMAEKAATALLAATDAIVSSGSSPKGILAEVATCRGEVCRALGTPDPAWWHEAAELWRTIGQPYEQAYARFREAEAVLTLKGSRGQVRSLLLVALTTVSDLRALPLQGLINDLGKRARVDLTTPLQDERVALPAGLSSREVEVLRLIADGLTNRRIATALFISEATVATHVSHILRKLGVASRVEAGLAAHHFGLTDRARGGRKPGFDHAASP